MKPGGKNNKQNDALRMVQTQLDEKKKQCLEVSITLQSLQNHNALLVLQNQRVSQQLEILRDENDNLIKNLKFHISILEDRNRQILVEKRQLQIKHDTLRINHDSMCSQFQAYKINRQIQFEDLKKRQIEDRKQYQISQNNFHHALTEHSKLVKQISELKQIRDQQKQIFKNKLADIERDKIQSIDIIKKQMTNKACQMRNRALQIRKQQFQTTTRLTFLQNDQLIRQLQFQSSKTQHILQRNIQLQKQVKDLKRSIEIHEGVQKQIMKRNVVAKNMISSLSHEAKIRGNKSKQHHRQVITDFVKIKSVGDCEQKNDRLDRSTKKSIAIQLSPSQQNVEGQQQIYQKVQILQQINKTLQQLNEQQTIKIKQLQKQCQNCKNQLKILKNKIGVNNCDNIASLMIRFYEQCVKPPRQKQADQQIQENQDQQQFNLQHLKKIQIEKWSAPCVQKIVNIILNLLRPYLSLKILKLPYFKSTHNDKITTFDYENLKQNVSASKYIQALKRQKNKSLESIKQRSITHILDEAQKLKHTSSHRRLSSTKISKLGGGLEPVAKRFIKPHLFNKV